MINEWATANMAASSDLAVTPALAAAGGDAVHHSGRWSLRIAPPGVPSFTSTGSHTFVWQRQTDGEWRLQMIHIADDPQLQS